MQTAIEVHEQIVSEAKAKAVQEVRHIDRMAVGQCVRQGDIYIHRVKPAHGKGKLLTSNKLAEGETQGSRHEAVGVECYAGTQAPEGCTFKDRDGDDTAWPLLGPRIIAKSRFSITHPEHAHVCLPAGDYQITHQMDSLTRQRVQD